MNKNSKHVVEIIIMVIIYFILCACIDSQLNPAKTPKGFSAAVVSVAIVIVVLIQWIIQWIIKKIKK